MKRFHGVNMGGWFVLESWIKPSLFEGIDDKDETGFMLHQKDAEKKLIEHWETFINEDDFAYLKSIGITSVRLPIPWWLEGNPPYVRSVEHIKKAMRMAANQGVEILLDLHTAPGCQNGFDNGGIQGVMDWHKDQKYIDLTVDRLGFIAQTFKDEPSFAGIQVLNEPFVTIDLSLIQDFYKDAYRRIRSHTEQLIVFHDAFRPEDPSWVSFFKDSGMTNVAFDIHLYHCFDPKLTKGTIKAHTDRILKERIPLIKKLETFVPVIVGEWSLGLRFETMKVQPGMTLDLTERLIASMQLYAYSYATGYYFWNYKIEQEGRKGWDLKRLIAEGIMPKDYRISEEAH